MLNHPELRSEIVSLLPTPDLTDMEEKLNFLKKNIYKVTYRTAVLRLQIPPDPDQHVERRDPTLNPHIKRSGSKTMMARMNYCSPKVTVVYILHPPPGREKMTVKARRKKRLSALCQVSEPSHTND